MSFGSAAPRARSLSGTAPCPCGAGRYGACCGVFHGGAAAPTAEKLMRSRYTAFFLGDVQYVKATWHPSTAPTTIDLDASLRWQRLEVVRTEAGGPGDTRGVVEFRAHWRQGDARGALHEVSRFRIAAQRWFYLDGEVGEQVRGLP